MKLTLYQIDAFTDQPFKGNPAAVVPLTTWLPDELMQSIAAENNLSETVFFTSIGNQYEIRWFTPTVEVDLCGHATLAAGFVLFNFVNYEKKFIEFISKSGPLRVEKNENLYILDFPCWKPEPYRTEIEELRKILNGESIIGLYKSRDLIVELENQQAVQRVSPNFLLLKTLKENIIITAPGNGNIDFVSRFFAPCLGVNEDPVTGSAHSQLIPFWAGKLDKKEMVAQQLSSRGGTLFCRLAGDRVLLAGSCVCYLKGEIYISDLKF